MRLESRRTTHLGRAQGAPLRTALLLAVAAVTAAAAEPATLAGRALGTTWSAKWLQPVAPLSAAAVERQLTDCLEQAERHFSTYRPDSVLSRFNASRSTEWQPVPAEVAHAAARAREISALTDGAFDVTVGPLLKLWGFGPFRSRETWPRPAEIATARALVGWRQIEVRLDPPALRKTRATVVADFSSIAKGLAVDALSDLLRSLGASNHLVQIGGDVKAAGPGHDGRGWRVGIEQPQEGARGIARVVQLRDRALSTSGNTRNFVILGGRRAGHLIDPRTGSPVDGSLASVSVIHASCASSSALATGLFVLGSADGLALADRETIAALFLAAEPEALTDRATPSFPTEAK